MKKQSIISKIIDGMRVAVALMIMFPIVAVGSVFMFMYNLFEKESAKCKWWRTCQWYDQTSPVCNEDCGLWGEGYAGCFYKNADMEAEKKLAERRAKRDKWEKR